MLDSIFIGTSGLQTFSAGLKSISNNIANLNTSGFKSSSTLFSNLYYNSSSNGNGQLSADAQQFGGGVVLSHTLLNFRAGEQRQTGNPLDLIINGEGFFITRKDGTGESHYSRAGQFEFNKDGGAGLARHKPASHWPGRQRRRADQPQRPSHQRTEVDQLDRDERKPVQQRG